MDDDRSIYIIADGYVDVKKKEKYTEEDGTQQTRYDTKGQVIYQPEVLRLVAGDCFGESCLLYIDDDAEYRRNYSAIAATDVTLYMLNRVAINALKESTPEAVQHLKSTAQRRLERMHTNAVNALRAEGVDLSEDAENDIGTCRSKLPLCV